MCVSPETLPSESFEQLAMPLFERLYNFACWLTHDRHEAEDLVQETYAKALKGFSSFQPGTNFRAWIYKILRNAFLNSRTGLKAATVPIDVEGNDEALPAVEETPESLLLQRSDWSLVDCYEVETSEIYDLLLVPKSLAQGAAIGFRTNATRVEQQDQLAMFASVGVTPRRLWAVGEPLPLASLRASLETEIPAAATVDEVFILPCRVTNAGDAIFVSAPPNPVQFCYRWFDASGAPVGAGEWIHTPLPHALRPGEVIDACIRITAPHIPGDYTLAVTLLQEGVAWFDDLSAASGVRATTKTD